MSPAPFVLLLDDEPGSLTGTALDLVRLGVQVLYTRWADEALLLAEQEAPRVRLLIVSSTAAQRDVSIVRSRLGRLLSAETADAEAPGVRLLVVQPSGAADPGPLEPGPDKVLRAPFDTDELRFVVNSLLAPTGSEKERREPRAPVGLMTWITVGDSRTFGVLYTLSAGGAFVELADPPAEGADLLLEFSIPPEDEADLDLDESLRLAARVSYRHGPREGTQPSRPTGVGVVFEKLSARAEERIRSFVESRAERYQP